MADLTTERMHASPERAEELRAALGRVRERVATACRAAGRDPAEVDLLAVSKGFPAADVAALAAAGVTDFGENRDREAAEKAAAVPDVRWHFVGRLQRNKCRSVARYASVVESVDSLRLADALAEAAQRQGRTVTALVQLSVDGAVGRGGAVEGDLFAVAERVASAEWLQLGGVMAIAPQQMAPDAAFAQVERVAGLVRARFPEARTVSAGMSGDMEAAIRHGATCVRVGTALFGVRAPLVR